MSAWARPGVKCVCVEDGVLTSIHPGPAVYTVDSVFEIFGVLHVKLAEKPTGGEWAKRFRPLVTIPQEQDVAKFRHLLSPSPIDAGLVPAGVELDA